MATLAAATTVRSASGRPTAYQSVPTQGTEPAVRVELLADLLDEIGLALEDMPAARLASAAAPIAAITVELLNQADVQAYEVRWIADPAAPLAVSLRTLGVLAARTIGSTIAVDDAAAAHVRTLLQAA